MLLFHSSLSFTCSFCLFLLPDCYISNSSPQSVFMFHLPRKRQSPESKEIEIEREQEMKPERSTPRAPPWEVLLLISHFLEPETLVKASCVCKSWRGAFTSDHLWRPICLASYPSSFHLVSCISSYHLFSLFFSASKRRYNHPSPLRLSLNHLFFTIELFHCKGTLVSVVKPGEEAVCKSNGIFKFEADLTTENVALSGEPGEMSAGWTVVMKGFNGAFSMMEREGKGRMIGPDRTRIWFNEKLLVPGCCMGLMPEGTGMEAEMVVEICEEADGKKMLEKVQMGFISGCRYVALEDGLRYLQYFLLKNDKMD